MTNVVSHNAKTGWWLSNTKLASSNSIEFAALNEWGRSRALEDTAVIANAVLLFVSEGGAARYAHWVELAAQ